MHDSLVVSVDAVDFSKTMPKKVDQFQSKFIRRELHKMRVGLKAAMQDSRGVKDVYTGAWGRGVFKGDKTLKFCLQWIACSQLRVAMRFTEEDQKDQL